MKFKVLPLVVAILTTNTASAAVITKNSDCNISISGKLGSEYANTEVQIQITGPFDEKKISEETVFDVDGNNPVFMTNSYINTVTVDENGEYSFVYDVSEEDKFYHTMVLEPSSTEVQSVNIYAVSSGVETQFLSDVSLKDANTILGILKGDTYVDILVGNRSDFEKITDEASIGILAAILADTNYEDFSDFEEALTTGCAVLLTNKATTGEDARKIAEEKLNLSELQLYDVYSSFSTEVKSAVFERMLNENFTRYEEYIGSFQEGVFLEKVKMEKYASNMTNLITANQHIFNFDLSNYSQYFDKVNAKLYGKDYVDMNDFKSKLKKAIDDAKGSGLPGGGGGGGGGNTNSSPQGLPVVTGNAVAPIIEESKRYFDDLDGVKWAFDAINDLAKKGVIAGRAERQFAPMDNIKREEFVKMIVNAFGFTANDADEISFNDVSDDAWYYNDIKIAYSLGIINGIDEKHFGAGNLITRQDMATILYRAAEKMGKVFSEEFSLFSDDANMAEYAKKAVYALKNAGVISGTGDNTFEPNASATRAQAAKMIFEIMQK